MAKKEITVAQFVNSLNFFVAFVRFENLSEENPDLLPHVSKGLIFLRQTLPTLKEGMDSFLGSFAENINRDIFLTRALDASNVKMFVSKAYPVLSMLFERLSVSQAKMREIFPDRYFRMANVISNAMVTENASEAVFTCAGNLGPGRPGAITSWLKEASNLVKIPLTNVESSLVEVDSAKTLGSALGDINTRLAFTPPNTPEAEDLQNKKTDVLEAIDTLVEKSAEPEIVFQTAVRESLPKDSHPNHLTRMGAKLGLTFEQEDAMLTPGLTEIVAGAGSGKTRVLAGKIADLINDKNVPSWQIIGCSFSRKSAKELRQRILKYGGPNVLDGGDAGIGTTHSLCLKILREDAPAISRRNIMESNDSLIKLAMIQVMMNPTFKVDPPEEKGFFDGLVNTFQKDTLVTRGDEEQETRNLEEEISESTRQYRKALEEVIKTCEWVSEQYGNQRWVKEAREAAEIFLRKTPETLTPQERAVFNKITGLDGKRNQFRKNVLRVAPQITKLAKTAAKKNETSSFYKKPANEWFNLGKEVKKEIEKISVTTAQTEISWWKGNLITPSQAYKEDKIFGSIYGAYEWLKANDQSLGMKMDFDDILIETSKLLVGNKNVREKLQERYKYVVVDEAQDLNTVQHVIFGIIAGAVDPATRKFYEDCRHTAKDYTIIGDDKQCQAKGTLIKTPSGDIPIENLKEGDPVLSYRRKEVVPQIVKHVVPSSWTHGIEITTKGGRKLLMSPNHKIWATEINTNKGEWCVYLMYRCDLGFRVGITKTGHEGSLHKRARPERAEKMWILNVCSTKEEALEKESVYSMTHSIPTCVFKGENRGLSQERLNRIFSVFGKNGINLLREKNLSFELPHWISSAYGKFERERRVINFTAHTPQANKVIMEWKDPSIDEIVLKNIPPSSKGEVFKTGSKNKRVRRYFQSYREALSFSEKLRDIIPDSMIRERLHTEFGDLHLLTASGLFPNMEVLVLENGELKLDTILHVEEKEGEFVDLDVDDASNFFGNEILSHNSIYSFRGAQPKKFVDISDEMGGCFKTKKLTMNYRSGKAIVDAANRLIAINEGQIPMTCDAHVEKNGMGSINSVVVGTPNEGASMAIGRIDEMKNDIGYGGQDGTPNFGIAVRTNAEALAYVMECLKRKIPFRSKISIFRDPTTKAILKWMSLANASDTDRDIINEAVLSAHKNPGFFLNATFETRLQAVASSYNRNVNYLEVLEENWNYIYEGKSAWRNRNIREYLDTLREVFSWTGTPSEILQKVLNLSGVSIKGKDPLSMKQSLIEEAKKDPVVSERVNSQSGEEPTDLDWEMEALAPISVLIDLAKDYSDMGPFMAYMSELQNVNTIKHKEDNPDAEDYMEPAVVIDTIHGWKGLECHHLFVPMVGDTFPHLSAGNNKEAMEDERRLAYVAITRGQESVTIISPQVGMSGKVVNPSRFIEEACVYPMGMDSSTQHLDEDRVQKSASSLYESILSDDSYEEPVDPFSDWDTLE